MAEFENGGNIRESLVTNTMSHRCPIDCMYGKVSARGRVLGVRVGAEKGYGACCR